LSSSMRPQGVAQVTRDLRKIDRGSLNALRKDMRQSIMGIAQEIASEVPSVSPMPGMRDHEGVTSWGGSPRASVSFTPGRGRGGGKRLLAMKFTSKKKSIGFEYLELAGSSKRPGSKFSKVYSREGSTTFQHRVTNQGKAFNEKIARAVQIKGTGGYFVFDSALKKHGRIEGLGKRAISKYMRDATREIQRVRAV
jgi:hypothetical protein